MKYEFDYGKVEFVDNHVCVLTFNESTDVNEEIAHEVLEKIQEHTRAPVYIIFNRQHGYSYQIGALQLLSNRKMFSKVCVVSYSNLATHFIDYEGIVSDRKLEVFDNLKGAINFCHQQRELLTD